MSTIKLDSAVPAQAGGAASDTESSTTFTSDEAAKDFYAVVKNRLLQVSHWQEWAGAATAHFQLTDATGSSVDRAAQEGDYFKIDIPGPGPATGDGFDWVQVEHIRETESENGAQIVVQVRPASNPNNDKKDIAHFFSSDATSCFIVTQTGDTVTAAVHGRNEKPNTAAETMLDKARNVAVATGAAAAFSKLQWKSLVSGLVRQEQ